MYNQCNNNLMREMIAKNNQRHNLQFGNFTNNEHFQNKIDMAKMAKLEKLKQVKNISEAGLSNNELISLVINPIKIEKLEKRDTDTLLLDYQEKKYEYGNLSKFSSDNKKTIVPKQVASLWNGRKNNPYKNILHFLDINDYTKKDYKKEKDLIIHKTTQLDKIADISRLKTELKRLEGMLFNHDKELKTIYSNDKKKKYLENFEYENKYKNKIKYDPKNCSELKELYKNEQKKINKQNKRIDDMIELLMASEDLSKEELDEIKKIQEIQETINISNDKNDKKEKNNEKKEEKKEEKEEEKGENNETKEKYRNRNSEKKIVLSKKNIHTDTNAEPNSEISKDNIRDKYKNRN